MQNYLSEFITYCLEQGALKFGQFTLKSGRISPYFFNAGELMKTGASLAKLGHLYAQCIQQHTLDFDTIFGPAYKGIPLAAVTAASLHQQYQQDKGFCHNRKEAKQHGEGGQLVGDIDLTGKKVLILDDVITAGTAIKQAMQLLNQTQARLSSIVLLLDRQEKNAQQTSTLQAIADQYKVPIVAIMKLDDIMTFLEKDPKMQQHLEAIKTYQQQYGI
jgi:orotate phosphoribosyltransferase